jgi:glycosyltransferase involved in cell wall biosynthesis
MYLRENQLVSRQSMFGADYIMLENKSISIIIPHFKSSAINEIVEKINIDLIGKLDFEIIIVDDSKLVQSWLNLNDIFKNSSNVTCLELSKNFGQHNSILAGISVARNELIVTIDDDLQVDPDQILIIYKHLIDRNLDLVYGIPFESGHSSLRKLASNVLKSILGKVLLVKSAKEINSFRIFRKNLLYNFSENSTGDVSIDAMLFWCTGNYESIKVNHQPRKYGKSTYNFKKLFNLAVETILGYSTLPLRLSTYLGLFITLLGSTFLIFVVFRLIINGITIQGYLSTIAAITIFSGVQLTSLGIIGEYLRKIHINSMRKPTFIIRNKIQHD